MLGNVSPDDSFPFCCKGNFTPQILAMSAFSFLGGNVDGREFASSVAAIFVKPGPCLKCKADDIFMGGLASERERNPRSLKSSTDGIDCSGWPCSIS